MLNIAALAPLIVLIIEALKSVGLSKKYAFSVSVVIAALVSAAITYQQAPEAFDIFVFLTNWLAFLLGNEGSYKGIKSGSAVVKNLSKG